MNSSFALINGLVNFLAPLSIEWFVSGGWAIDIYLNRVTRKRCDLDISVPFSDRLKCIEFFLREGWRIEGKLGGGFRTLRKVSDYNDDIHYFWSFPEGADFVSEYVDGDGNRRIAYNRDSQNKQKDYAARSSRIILLLVAMVNLQSRLATRPNRWAILRKVLVLLDRS